MLDATANRESPRYDLIKDDEPVHQHYEWNSIKGKSCQAITAQPHNINLKVFNMHKTPIWK